MTKPVTNAEIEDVLSAVRRLVSANDDARREERVEEPAGKLVLTPAFRVDTPVTEVAAEVAAELAVEADAAKDNGSDPSLSVEELVQETVATEVAQVLETSLDEVGIDLDLSDEAPMAVDAEAEGDDWGSASVTQLHDRAVDEDRLEEEPSTAAAVDEGADAVTSLEDRIAELEAVVTDSGAVAVDADDVEDEIEAPTPVQPMSDADVETPVAAVNRDTAPDTTDAVQVDAQDWEDVDEAEVVAFEQTQAADEDRSFVEEPDVSSFAPDLQNAAGNHEEMVIDEDMLREIVGRLVREELQGTMGERITRNLRRMVRREIARALALKDYD